MIKLFFFASLLFLTACGSTSSGNLNIDEIRERLNQNSCRINREEAVFRIVDLEYIQDSLFTEIPEGSIDDSLLVCPVTGEFYVFLLEGEHRKVLCASGHGESLF